MNPRTAQNALERAGRDLNLGPHLTPWLSPEECAERLLEALEDTRFTEAELSEAENEKFDAGHAEGVLEGRSEVKEEYDSVLEQIYSLISDYTPHNGNAEEIMNDVKQLIKQARK